MRNVPVFPGIVQHPNDAAENLVVLIDPVGNVTRWVDNFRGQVVQQTDPRGKTTAFAFDDSGRLTSTTDRLGRVREFTYLVTILLPPLWERRGKRCGCRSGGCTNRGTEPA